MSVSIGVILSRRRELLFALCYRVQSRAANVTGRWGFMWRRCYLIVILFRGFPNIFLLVRFFPTGGCSLIFYMGDLC